MRAFSMRDPAFLAACQPTGGGAFDPLSITGCVLWLKADGSCYNTGTTQATDGQTVETWVDASASSANVSQSTSGYRPTFESSGINSLPSLYYDGSDDFLGVYTDILTGASAVTGFCVVEIDADPPAANSESGPWVGSLGTDALPGHYPNTDGDVYIDFGTNSRKYAGNPSTSLATAHVSTIISASANWRLLINGTVAGSTGTNTFAKRGSSPYAFVGKADPGYATSFLKGYISEVIMYNAALSDSDREYIETGLGAKYGITITH